MKKLMSIAILFCGLMLGKLGAEEILFQKDSRFWLSGETDYCPVALIEVTGQLRVGEEYWKDKEYFITNNMDMLKERELVSKGYVCSKEVVSLFSEFIIFSAPSHSLELDSLKSPILAESTRRKVNKYSRNLQNIGLINDYRISFLKFAWGEQPFYDYVKKFNLFEKMKLSYSRKSSTAYKNHIVMHELQSLAKGNGHRYSDIKAGVDDNTLEDLYYEFRDFASAKIQELSTIRMNHTEKLFENACVPIEKIEKTLIHGDKAYIITFDETRIKHLEDLNLTPQPFQFLPEQERKFIEWKYDHY